MHDMDWATLLNSANAENVALKAEVARLRGLLISAADDLKATGNGRQIQKARLILAELGVAQ